MAISVAPLTTTVLNAVPAHQTGVASGINNAVSSLAGLLAVAIFGAVSLGIYDHGLDHSLRSASASPELKQAVQAARGQFTIAPAASGIEGIDRELARMIIKASLAESIRGIMPVSYTHLDVYKRQQRSGRPRPTTRTSSLRHLMTPLAAT